MPYLYAYTKSDHYGSMDVALVSYYKTREEAQESFDVQMMCHSDDGIFFSIQDRPVRPAPNITFESLVERMSK